MWKIFSVTFFGTEKQSRKNVTEIYEVAQRFIEEERRLCGVVSHEAGGRCRKIAKWINNKYYGTESGFGIQEEHKKIC